MVAMSAIARPYYNQVRRAEGLRFYEGMKQAAPLEPGGPDEIDSLLSSPRPMVLTIVGVGGLAVILWLMVLKPF